MKNLKLVILCLILLPSLTKATTFNHQQMQLEQLIIQANQDNADAQTELGLRFYHALGTKDDTQQALFWFNKAAAHNNEEALLYKGIILASNPDDNLTRKAGRKLIRAFSSVDLPFSLYA